MVGLGRSDFAYVGPGSPCCGVSRRRADSTTFGRVAGRVTLGALLEIFLMIGNVGTAVVMFPILGDKRNPLA